MVSNIQIEEIKRVDDVMEELSELLQKVVDDGASIGFLPPMKQEVALKYWEDVLALDVILFIAKINNEIAGSVQLHLCTKENGMHRAEIAKLMTHPHFRRQGVARTLMKAAEERAKQENRSLLVLDTREGDPSNELYKLLDFIESGRIPYYAQSANGELDSSVFYYKRIDQY